MVSEAITKTEIDEFVKVLILVVMEDGLRAHERVMYPGIVYLS